MCAMLNGYHQNIYSKPTCAVIQFYVHHNYCPIAKMKTPSAGNSELSKASSFSPRVGKKHTLHASCTQCQGLCLSVVYAFL